MHCKERYWWILMRVGSTEGISDEAIGSSRVSNPPPPSQSSSACPGSPCSSHWTPWATSTSPWANPTRTHPWWSCTIAPCVPSWTGRGQTGSRTPWSSRTMHPTTTVRTVWRWCRHWRCPFCSLGHTPTVHRQQSWPLHISSLWTATQSANQWERRPSSTSSKVWWPGSDSWARHNSWCIGTTASSMFSAI